MGFSGCGSLRNQLLVSAMVTPPALGWRCAAGSSGRGCAWYGGPGGSLPRCCVEARRSLGRTSGSRYRPLGPPPFVVSTTIPRCSYVVHPFLATKRKDPSSLTGVLLSLQAVSDR